MSEILDVYLQIGTHEPRHLGTLPAADDKEHVHPYQLAALLHASALKIQQVADDRA